MIPPDIGFIPSGLIVYLLTAFTFSIAAYYAYRIVLRAAFSGRSDLKNFKPLNRLLNTFGYIFSQKCSLRNISHSDRAGLGHFIIFWAFIVFLISHLIFIFGESVYEGFVLIFFNIQSIYTFHVVLEIMALSLLTVLIWTAIRRYVVKPPRLRMDLTQGYDALIIIIWISIIVLTYLIAESLFYAANDSLAQTSGPVAKIVGSLLIKSSVKPIDVKNAYIAVWWFHLCVTLSFAIYIPFSKHSHIFITPLALFLRSSRHKGTLEYISSLKEAQRYGGMKVSDFTWKQLLDGFSCAICGRCSQVCPATISEKPLSPMHVIYTVRQCLKVMEGENRLSKNNILFGDAISQEPIWNCTTCFACQQECPNKIEHVNFIIELRRHLLHQSKINSSAAKAMEAMLFQGNPWGEPAIARLNWIEGQKVKLIRDRKSVEVLFWIGCAGSYDPKAVQATNAMIEILEMANVDYAILGIEERCCGEGARRMGEEGLWQTLAQKNIDVFGKYKFDMILTACPHCYNTLRNEYLQLGSEFHVIHHSKFLFDLIHKGSIKLHRAWPINLTYHDPCYLGRYNDQYEYPRKILQAIPKTILNEADPCRENALCCGGGGGQFWIQSEKGRRIEDVRLEQLMKNGSKVISTACPYCNIMLNAAAAVRENDDLVRIRDIAELVIESSKI
jgi:Fe-S oxidoreductase